MMITFAVFAICAIVSTTAQDWQGQNSWQGNNWQNQGANWQNPSTNWQNQGANWQQSPNAWQNGQNWASQPSAGVSSWQQPQNGASSGLFAGRSAGAPSYLQQQAPAVQSAASAEDGSWVDDHSGDWTPDQYSRRRRSADAMMNRLLGN